MKEPLFEVEWEVADDPPANGHDTFTFEEVVRQYPDFARLLLDPHFVHLNFTVDLTETHIRRLEPEPWGHCPECHVNRPAEEWINDSDVCDECRAALENLLAAVDEDLRQEALWDEGSVPLLEPIRFEEPDDEIPY